MTDLLERDFQDNVIQLARLLGWKIAHFRPAKTSKGWRTPMQGDKGFPDLVLAKKGRVIFAELKSEKGKVTADQWAWLEEVLGTVSIADDGSTRLSPEAYVWRPSNIDEIQRILNEHV